MIAGVLHPRRVTDNIDMALRANGLNSITFRTKVGQDNPGRAITDKYLAEVAAADKAIRTLDNRWCRNSSDKANGQR